MFDSKDDYSSYVFNTADTIVDHFLFPDTSPDAIWTTASGFKSFAEWYFRGASPHCQIHTYDCNTRSIALWRHIHKNWDGHNIYDFVKLYDSDCENESLYCWGRQRPEENVEQCSARLESELVSFFGNTDSLCNAWKKFQGLQHFYHQSNVIEDPDSLIKYMDPSMVHFLWLNNIFYFKRNILQYGMVKIRQSLTQLAEHLHFTASASVLHGESAFLHFHDHPLQIIENLKSNHTPKYNCVIMSPTGDYRKSYPTLR